jgi:hypothetical protein
MEAGMETKINEAMQRTRRYWYEDGLGELSVGGLFLLMGGLMLAAGGAGPQSRFGNACAALLTACVAGGTYLLNRFIRRMKEQITYPRTGYIAPPRPVRRYRGVSAAGAVAAGLLIAWLVTKGGAYENWMPAVQGLIAGGILFLVGAAAGVNRLTLEGAAVLAFGLALPLAGVGMLAGSASVYLFAGAVMAIGGGLTLRRYLQTYGPSGGDF